MKNKFIYWGITVCMILGFMACENENDNWVIVTDVQPGVYVSGPAVVYKSIAPATSFKPALIDTAFVKDKKGIITSIHTWLKANEDLYITKADAQGNVVNYGKGQTVSDVTSTLAANAPAFKVTQEGLYLLIYNSELDQLTIVAAKYGIIGAATPNGWGGETLFTSVTYNEASATVELKGTYPLSKDKIKFRFNGGANGGWGMDIPYDATTPSIRVHTNLGSTSDSDNPVELTSGSTELKSGGKDLTMGANAAYDIIVKLDLRTGKFYASAIQGEIIVTPEYPEKLYMIGADFGNWDWISTGIVQMVPVNGAPNAFWCINYFNANNGFKWSPVKDWKGDFAQLANKEGYEMSGNDAIVTTSGLYMVYIDLKTEKITIEPAKIYGIGNSFGGWDEGKNPFTINGDKASITVSADGDLRMYAGSAAATSDWWSREFNIFDGKIIYRGAGGDQAAVPVKAGNVITLDFKNGNGSIQ